MSFEYVPKLHLMVSYQQENAPADEEWDAYLAAIEEASLSRHFRSVVITEGGYPTHAQRARLIALVKTKPTRVAVISVAASVRFVVSVFALINPNVKAYAPKELAQAFSHLGLAPAQHADVEAVVEKLRQELETGRRAAA